LTFDDARLSQIDRGLAILDRHGVKATFYVTPAGMQARLDGWRRAVAAGHEIGNHTLTHPCSGNFAFSRGNALEDYTLERMEAELLEGNKAIEQSVGVRPTTFAYPCGQTFVGRGEATRSYVPLISRHFIVGRGAFDEVPAAPAVCDLAQVNGLDGDSKSFEQLKGLIDVAIAEGAWLVLFGHEVGDAGHQTTRADALDALCRFAKDPACGLWVDTVATIGGYIKHMRNG
jgi:peptidoglycan/xylan/chitin deacetylase (PgdA/CDA1 family)